MSTVTTSPGYTAVAVALHWLTAACVLALFVAGKLMSGADEVLGFENTIRLYQWHKSLGVLVFVLTIMRIGWRLAHRPPDMPAWVNPWQARAARITHIAFYALLLLIPLSGWAVVSASTFQVPTVLFGLVRLPHIPLFQGAGDPEATAALTEEIHEWLGWAMAVLVALHVAGAMSHHFGSKRGYLRRIWFGRYAR